MNNLILSLEITALGMGLVFGAILLLWLTMVILTAVTAEKESPAEEESASGAPEPVSQPQPDSRLQVALLAVAMALAEQGGKSARPLAEPPTALVSAWQLGMRTRQMSEKGKIKRR